MKKLIAAILLAVTLTGCIEQPISTSYHTVQATVTDVSRRYAGNNIRRYYVHISYKDITEKVRSKSLYKEYKDKIGQTIEATLVRHTYEDGTVKEELCIKD